MAVLGAIAYGGLCAVLGFYAAWHLEDIREWRQVRRITRAAVKAARQPSRGYRLLDVPAAPEPDTHDDHCGTDDQLLAECRDLFNRPARQEDQP